MVDSDFVAFLAALNEMGAIFCDELPELRQRLYWQFFRDGVSLEEWQAACYRAMTGETFYKVPLPAVLMEYVRDVRKARRLDGPRLREVEEDSAAQAQVRALIDSVWPGIRNEDSSIAD